MYIIGIEKDTSTTAAAVRDRRSKTNECPSISTSLSFLFSLLSLVSRVWRNETTPRRRMEVQREKLLEYEKERDGGRGKWVIRVSSDGLRQLVACLTCFGKRTEKTVVRILPSFSYFTSSTEVWTLTHKSMSWIWYLRSFTLRFLEAVLMYFVTSLISHSSEWERWIGVNLYKQSIFCLLSSAT